MNSPQYLETGLAHHQAGRLEQAESSYHKALKLEPNNSDALNLLGLVAYQRGDYTSAVDLIGKSVSINPRFCQAQVNYGNALAAQSRYAEASQAYDAALDIEKNNPDALYGKGTCAQNTDRLNEALEAFQKALKVDANNLWYLLAYAHTLQLSAQYEKAIAHYEQASRIAPDNARIHHDLGVAWQMLGDLEQSESAFRKAIELESGMHLAHTGLGNVLRRTGRAVDAINAFETALRLRPDDAATHCFLSAAWLETGNSEEAMRSIERSRQLNPYDRRAMAYEIAMLTERGRKSEAGNRLLFDDLLRLYEIDLPEKSGDAMIGDIESFNDALEQIVRQHPSLEFERTGNTTRKGSQTGNLLESENDALRMFVGSIESVVAQYFSDLPVASDHPYLAWRPDGWQLVAWGVVLESQGHQNPHIHPDGWLSGVYYVRVPGSVTAGSEEKPGCLEVGRPPDTLNCKMDALIRVIEPQEGRFVLFPSYFYHRTIPFESDQQRICIAFDVKPINMIKTTQQ